MNKYSVCGNILFVEKVAISLLESPLSDYAKKKCCLDKSVEGIAFYAIISNFIKYRFFNLDGSEEMLCGNSIFALGVFLKLETSKRIMLTNNNCILVTSTDAHITINIEYELNGLYLDNNVMNVGTPHYVTIVPDVSKIDWNQLEIKPNLNYTFYQLCNNHIAIARTYERGVNSETLSCGTGAISVFMDSIRNGYSIEQVDFYHFRSNYTLKLIQTNSNKIGIEMKLPTKNIVKI